MTSDQIYLQRAMGREKKERRGCFGNTVHLTFMPIKPTELNWRERAERWKEKAESRDRGQNERRVRKDSTDRKKWEDNKSEQRESETSCYTAAW